MTQHMKSGFHSLQLWVIKHIVPMNCHMRCDKSKGGRIGGSKRGMKKVLKNFWPIMERENV